MRKALACITAAAMISLPALSHAETAAGISGASADGGVISVDIASSTDQAVRLYAASYDGGVLSGLTFAEVQLSAGNTAAQVAVPGSGEVFLYLWDDEQVPICDKYALGEQTVPDMTEEPSTDATAAPDVTEEPSTEATAAPDVTDEPSTEVTDAPDVTEEPTETTGGGTIHLCETYIDISEATGVTLDETQTIVTIETIGEYTIDGTLNDGQIVVSEDLGKKDAVTINLAGVDVTSLTAAPFNASSGAIEIVLVEGTDNKFTDAAAYTDYTTAKDPKGCFYARRDMDIGGTGTLTIDANVKNALTCGADLKIKDGANIVIDSVDNGIKGNNGVTFTKKTGTVKVTSGGDAIKSDAIDTLTVDTTEYSVIEADKGYVEIKGGAFTLNAAGDGIQADNYVTISGGTVDITSGTEGIKANEVGLYVYDGDETLVTDTTTGEQMYINGCVTLSGGTVTVVSGEDGIKAAQTVDMSGADITVTATGTDAADGSGYDAVQAGDSVDTVDGTTTTRTITCPGTINMSGGSLNVLGSSDDAIVCKGSMTVTGGTMSGTSSCDFIKVYDELTISDGTFEITSGNDGIQSGRALTETVSGTETISSNYTAGNITISGGTFNITAGGGSKVTLADDADSCKGIKANTEFTITGGNFTIDSADDTLHSNYNMTVENGTFALATGDDGLHADYILTIGTDGGDDTAPTIDISTSYEGIEGSVINILSGTQYIYSTDDGINAAGDYTEDGQLSEDSSSGSTGSTGNTRPGGGWGGPDQGMDDTSPYGMLYIKGGKTYVEAYGDGLDTNGSAEMSAGIVLVNGPTNSGNGVFDIGDSGNCYFNITGGTLIGAGTSGMIVTPTVSGQGYVSTSGSMGGGMGGNRPGQSGGTSGTSSGSAGSPVKITTDSGSMIFIPKVNWQFMFVTSDDMTSGGSYTIESVSSYTGEEILGKTVNGTFYGLVNGTE